MRQESQIIFQSFRLDKQNEQLFSGSQRVLLRPKTFAVLQYLAENPDRLVAKEELISAVWPKTRVVEGALKVSIGEIRKALGDESKHCKFIETVGKKGYRFIAPMSLKLPEPGRESYVPFVGRTPELDRLRHHLEIANGGKRQVVFVTGEPGIGKTTLVEAFLKSLPSEGGLVAARGQCIEQYGAGEAYMPILDALDRMCNGPNKEQLPQLLRQYAPSWLVNLPHIIDPDKRSELDQQTAGTTPERKLREIAGFLEAISNDRTILLILEDLHWLDPSSLALISFLARRDEQCRLMLVGTYRRAEVESQNHPLKQAKEELELHRFCSHLPLKLLSRSAVGEYLAARFETPLVSSKVLSTVHQRSEGNPLFMINMTDYLLASETITQQHGSVELSRQIEKEATPTTLSQLIERQFERLSPQDQLLLEIASVRCMNFSAATLSAVSGKPIEEVEKQCDQLVEHEHFLQHAGTNRWPDGTVSSWYSFVHALYQNVIYDRVGDARKVRLHQAIADRLEAGYKDATEDIAGELAIHFERAGDHAKAVHYLLEAAQKSFRQCAFQETLDCTRKVLEIAAILPETPQRREAELHAQLLTAVALSSSEGYASTKTKDAFDRAYTISRAVRNKVLLFHSLAGIWSFHLLKAELNEALKLARDMLNLASGGSNIFKLNARLAAGCALFYQGHARSAHEHLAQAVRHYDVEHHRKMPSLFGWDSGVLSHSYDAQALWFMGFPARAEHAAEQARALARTLHSPFNEALCSGLLSLYYAYCDDAAKLLETTSGGIKISAEGGFFHWLSLTTLLHGAALSKTGSATEGILQLSDGIQKWRSAGAELGLPLYLGLLARACMTHGSKKNASHYLAEAFSSSTRNDDCHYDAELYRLRGELALVQRTRANGQRAKENAEGHFHRAIQIARSHKSKSLELRATISLCRLWQKQGKEKQARQRLQKIYGWFTEGFDTPDLKQAKALLDELG